MHKTSSRLTIKSTKMAKRFQNLIKQHGSPLLILDCDQLAKQYQQLSDALPGVDFYYAIKSLPHAGVVNTLEKLGCGFDIATTGEINLLREQRVSPRRTIHTHPIKRDQDIRDALRFGCTTFVIDNIYELEKFANYRYRVGLLIRVSFPNPSSPVDLSRKFGCKPNEVDMLIQKAHSLGIRIKGLSFHAGSQSPDSSNHVHAIEQCREIIERNNSTGNKLLSILDIGGGFPVKYVEDIPGIQKFCAPIREALAKVPNDIQIIAEPGRFFSAPSMTSISSVMGKAHRGDSVWYYLDDGVYGSYSGQIYDHATYPITVFTDYEERENAVLSGPTCDSIDVIGEDLQLPPLAIGDIIVGTQMGAYTSASATDFNFFKRATTIVINQPKEEPVELSSVASIGSSN